MTTTAPTRPASPAHDRRALTGWDRAAIVALGTAGCALSYDALQQMAAAIHVRGPLTCLFPLVIDGFIAFGVRALVLTRTAPFRARLYVWTLFAAATAASIWANALHAVRLNETEPPTDLHLGDVTVGGLSTLAPLALGGAVHLYILIARQAPDAPRPPASDDFRTPTSEQPTAGAAADEEASTSVEHLVRPSDGDACSLPAPRTEIAEKKARQGRPPGAELEAMVPIARKAAVEHGRLSRQVVRNAVRSAGLTIGDERLTALMTVLRTGQPGTRD